MSSYCVVMKKHYRSFGLHAKNRGWRGFQNHVAEANYDECKRTGGTSEKIHAESRNFLVSGASGGIRASEYYAAGQYFFRRVIHSGPD